ncbi:MAG TPA: hypothetical protein VFA82_00370 [Gaiellaceae bacterium]|nr:hypothetical protein [Gaiellaceae bacterium]
MAELERELRALAAELRWPATPALRPRLEVRRRRAARPLVVALAALVVALAVALAVPSARSAILRILHLGGVSVRRVGTLPHAPARALTADLGPVVDRARAEAALGAAARGPGPFHLRAGVVSTVLRSPAPLLLSELRTGPVPIILKQLAGSGTSAAWLAIHGSPALWLVGARHVVRFPDAPARLAGNVLVWQSGPITLRLEGPRLDRATALRIANGT